MKIIVAGGGTGGHIIPNIAVLNALKTQMGADLDVLYIGSRKSMEAEMIPIMGWKFQGISCGKLRRYFSVENFLDGFRTIAGVLQSLLIINKFKPEVIFSKGGYVSLPVAVAGGILGVPVVIHESDVEPGLSTKISAKFARVICFSYEESRRKWDFRDKRVIVTGNPVREELADGVAEKGWKFSGLSSGKPVILAMGGSQGAQFINDLIEKNLDELLKHFQIIHIRGKGKDNNALKNRKGYFSTEYVGAELKDIYAITDLIISRSGANSLAEIAYLGLPAILIPLVAGSRGDQIENAEVFARENMAMVLDERIYRGNIIGEISTLLKKSADHKAKKKPSNAAKKIAEILISFKHGRKNKLKIGVNGRFLTKPFSGIGRYTINLFANLSRQYEDVELTMITPEEPANWVIRELGPAVRIVVIPEIGLLRRINAGLAKSVWERNLLGKFFRSQKVDIIHLPYPALFKPIGVPVVMTVHDTFPWTIQEYRNRNFLSGLYNGWTVKAARLADYLVPVSNWSREEILKLRGFYEGKMEVVTNACEFRGPLEDEAVLQRFGLEKAQYLLYMGGYDKRKNVQRLVNVFEEYVSPRCECKLVLGGASVLKNNLFEEVRITGAAENVVRTGFLENADLQALYSQAKAYISLTTAEGFNLPLLEALSTHCPALVSDLKVHREVAGSAAFYLDLSLNDAELGERIVTLLNDKKEYNSLKEKAEKFSSSADGKRFSWHNSAQKTVEIYKQLLQ